MEVTLMTRGVALGGLMIIGLLLAAQLVAVFRPRAEWTIRNVYGGDPGSTDPRAYFAFNQGYAWVDCLLWGPLQIAASVGLLMGQRWGFLLALAASVPFIYSSVPIYIWDRDMGFRENSLRYWIVVWGMFPAFGLLEFSYCFHRLMG